MLMKRVDVYLRLRRAAGSQLHRAEAHLRRFAHFATQRGDHHIKTATVIDWIVAETSSQDERILRLSEIIRFALFAKAEDACHQIPPHGIFGRRTPRRPPFTYSEEDIRRLVQAAAYLGPVGSLRSMTFKTLFALLAVTGLRISEALALRFNDLTADGLHIRDSKFHKSRWVPLHESTLHALQQYIEHRKAVAGADSHLFVSPSGGPLRRGAVYQVFRQLLKRIGLDCGSVPRRPRIHDLRHSFAVRALQLCPEGRFHVGRHTLALSTYLGHKDVSSTYWYLEATPQLMRDIAVACEEAFQGGSS